MLYVTAICNISVFLARITYGDCPQGVATSIWESQQCNPVAMCHSFPHDSVLMIYVPPVVMQAVFRGISLEAAIITYCFSGMAIAYAIYLVDGGQQMYTLLYLTTFVAMSYCHERWMRIWFIRTMLGDESVRSELRAHDQQQRLLREQELQSLRQELDNINRDREHETIIERTSKEKELTCDLMISAVRCCDLVYNVNHVIHVACFVFLSF